MNYEKIDICIDLIDKKLNKKEVESGIDIPIIDNDLDRYYYIFYSCLLDYGMNSTIYHKNLNITYNKFPYIFKPGFETNELFSIMKNNIHPRYPNVSYKKWIKLSNYLKDKDLLSSLSDYESIKKFVFDSKCYGQKTGNLLIRIICEIKNIDTLEIPIDRHDLEICINNSIIDRSVKINNNLKSELSKNLIKAAHIKNISACDIDKYLWHIGKKYCHEKNCVKCPLYTNCVTKK